MTTTAKPMVATSEVAGFVHIDLRDVFDNVGITAADATAGGGLNIWGNTLPADRLPSVGSLSLFGGVPFAFPARSVAGCDNLRCARQLLALPVGEYDWLHVIAAAERRTEDEVFLHYAGGATDMEWLRVSDFWPETGAWFGEPDAARCDVLHYPRHIQGRFSPTVWRQRIPVPRYAPLAAVRLPDNPAIHVFALTAQRRAGVAG
jgi:hypothetical protein